MGSPNDFDFWLGTWQANWQGEDGVATGRNTITKRFQDHVVYERFDGRPGVDFEGMSVSVYAEALDRWLQTWVDQEGNYFHLVGAFEDGEMTLHCRQDQRGDGAGLRMRFFNIADDRFDWSWERSDDGGKTWRTLWQIGYTRLPSDPPASPGRKG